MSFIIIFGTLSFPRPRPKQQFCGLRPRPRPNITGERSCFFSDGRVGRLRVREEHRSEWTQDVDVLRHSGVRGARDHTESRPRLRRRSLVARNSRLRTHQRQVHPLLSIANDISRTGINGNISAVPENSQHRCRCLQCFDTAGWASGRASGL